MTEKSNREFGKEDVLRAMSAASAAKAEVSSATGEHGQVVKQFVDQFGVERRAFTWARNLYDMEDDKRQGVIRDFLNICGKLGYLDQKDMFDDLSVRVVPFRTLGATGGDQGHGPVLNAKGQTVEQATAEELAEPDPTERDSAA